MRRRLIRIVLLLAIGAVINIAVAWGLAIRPYPFASSEIRWTSARGLTRTIFSYTGEVFLFEEGYRVPDYGNTAISNAEFARLVPSWSALSDERPTATVPTCRAFGEWGYGWPIVALVYRCWHESEAEGADTSIRYIGLLSLPQGWISDERTSQRSFSPRGSLPLLPIWPGFYVNTLLYACAAWLVFFAPFAALRFTKRARRQRKGLCLRCGYDLRGAASGASGGACPECGALLGPRP